MLWNTICFSMHKSHSVNGVLNRLHSIVFYLQGPWEFILSNELCTIHLEASFLLLCIGVFFFCFSKCLFLNKLILFPCILLTSWDNIWNAYNVSNSLEKIYIMFSRRLFTLVIFSTRIGVSLLAPFFCCCCYPSRAYLVLLKKKKIPLTIMKPC